MLYWADRVDDTIVINVIHVCFLAILIALLLLIIPRPGNRETYFESIT